MTCGWGDCANFFLTGTAKAGRPPDGATIATTLLFIQSLLYNKYQ